MAVPGSVVRVPLNIENSVTEAAADPSSLVAIVRNPAGTETTYTYGSAVEVVKDSVGNYHIDVTVPLSNSSTAVGRWYVRWIGYGANAGASPDASFRVSRSVLSAP
jgi:hypothetical protein